MEEEREKSSREEGMIWEGKRWSLITQTEVKRRGI